ncbi:MAG: serine--tRNA ligase [Mycoplasma sp.]
MLDINYIIDNKLKVIKELNKRGTDFTDLINDVIKTFLSYKANLTKYEHLNYLKNQSAEQVKLLKNDKNLFLKEIEKAKKISREQNELSITVRDLEQNYIEKLKNIPNVPHGTIPIGNNEKNNKVIKIKNSKPIFSFKPLNHWDIISNNCWLDENSIKTISGARFVYYEEFLSKLRRALISFFLDNNAKDDYCEIHPPILLNAKPLEGTGQLPKFEDDLFKIKEFNQENSLYLSPTAEVQITNKYRDNILDEEMLPIKLTAATQCFRKEAGSAGRDTRGLIRLHEFTKVEIVQMTTQDNELRTLKDMLKTATRILDKLKLHYRVVELCTGDLGFSSKKTYDIEVWLPGQECYREISSCSWCGDFQARRINTKYKNATGEKKYVYTFNSSSLPIERTIAAIIENYQTVNGTINIPTILKKYF